MAQGRPQPGHPALTPPHQPPRSPPGQARGRTRFHRAVRVPAAGSRNEASVRLPAGWQRREPTVAMRPSRPPCRTSPATAPSAACPVASHRRALRPCDARETEPRQNSQRSPAARTPRTVQRGARETNNGHSGGLDVGEERDLSPDFLRDRRRWVISPSRRVVRPGSRSDELMGGEITPPAGRSDLSPPSRSCPPRRSLPRRRGHQGAERHDSPSPL